MTRTCKFLALAALAVLFATDSMAPAGAATNQAVLNVSADYEAACDVLTQPGTLTMSYDPLSNVATLGTSSFTYACSAFTSVAVTPASLNVAGGPNWEAVYNSNDLLYTLWNGTACTTNQLTNGTSESLGNTGSGGNQNTTYNICAIPNLGQQSSPGGTYVDTVTFTFNFGP
jgi:hypothetical protein